MSPDEAPGGQPAEQPAPDADAAPDEAVPAEAVPDADGEAEAPEAAEPQDPEGAEDGAAPAAQEPEVPVEGETPEAGTTEQAAELQAHEVQPSEPVDDGAAFQNGVLVGGGIAAVIALALVGVMSRRQGPSLEQLPEYSEFDDDNSLVAEGAGPAPAPVSVGLAARLRERMSQSRAALQGQIDRVFGSGVVDDDVLEQLEEVLLVADVGMKTTTRLVDSVRRRIASGERDPRTLRDALRDEMLSLLATVHRPFEVDRTADPFVLMVVGVNGSGKTTTIGKLAARLRDEGHRVLLAAGDTYRGAAADQLEIWADRANVDIVRHDEGSDPGAVAFDALEAARARGCDVVIVDTAGRLHTAAPLMEQLGKVRRVIGKKAPGAPHETWLVLDGTMGQNAMNQARTFHETTPLTGVVVTKLDGTAKGGVVLAVAEQMSLPVRFIGIGERVEDLRPFEPDAFVEALL